MALSEHALKGISAPHTLKLAASIHNFKSIVLVDSRSSHNFISEHLASQLSPWTPLPHSMTVRVADGAALRYSHEIMNCSWSVNGTLFTTTFKILPLDCYDASSVGMEWLESLSPMQVQWKDKWLNFDYQGKQVKFQGIQENLQSSQEITLNQLTAMEKSNDIWGLVQVYLMESTTPDSSTPLPTEVTLLVEQFAELFTGPTGNPPIRSHTHSIPLLPGAQPFRLKPYRDTPAQKDEIEKQVAHLLKHHMIQKSSSPFAFPALLVKEEW